MNQLFKKVVLITISLVVTLSAYAQVTTSSMSGRVTEPNGTPIAGATVVMVHTPSGTQYYTVTDNSGNYRSQNMRVGGPYSVAVSILGFSTSKHEGAVLRLGENFVFDVVLAEDALTLEEAVVSAGVVNPILNRNKAGTSMNISNREITSLPTISRSITDFTRMTPQSNGSSFAGRDARMNTITIDGAAFNNNFGLSSNALPGGDAQPISLDAIEEVSVNIAPFDVRMSQFTGASINAVTKSGDNFFKGTAYTYLRPKFFTGDMVGDVVLTNARERSSQTYGVTFGGPIIKDKLFFFISGEFEKENTPSNAWEPSENGVSNTANRISRTTIEDLKTISDHLKSKYNYDPGKYQDFDPFKAQNYKIMARIDWNLSRNHKLTLRYNDVVSTNDQQTNANSAPNPRGSGRISAQSIAFQNSFYGFKNSVRSGVAELNSTFGSRLSNKFLVSYTAITDTRTSKSDLFPFVDIYKDGDQYMSFGYELFSHNNEVKNNTLTIINNLTLNLNNSHTLTFGLSYDNLYFKNAYMREATSYYRFNSMADFLNGGTPNAFAVTYGYAGNDAPGVELSFGMAALYAQDEWQVSSKFKLTYGLRLELPMYHNDIPTNNAIDSKVFADGYQMQSGMWPKSRLQFSPRIGFNWDIKGDRSLQLRGGTGLFSGMLPFVWFTNQPNGTGMIQSPEIIITDATKLERLKFNPDYKAVIANNPDLFPSAPDANYIANGASVAEVDKDFRMPQVWRTNLALDVELPWNTIFTLEALFSKDLNAVVQKDVNLAAPDKQFTGSDNRPYWTTTRVESSIRNAMVLSNSSKGYQSSITAQLTKNFTRGLSGMLAYTYTNAKDVSSNPGSTAASAWSSNTVVTYLNDPELSYSDFAIPHRVVGAITYRNQINSRQSETFSLYYSGSHQGRATYAYSNDMNGDGYSSDLMYIPKSKTDITFIDKGSWSAEDQAKVFWDYVESNKYLSKNKGKYAERFGDLEPWHNRFDFKYVRDIKFISQKKYGISISLDILNVANMINRNWGVYKTLSSQSYDRIRPLTYASGRNDGNLRYTLNANNAEDFKDKHTWTNQNTTGSTWGALLGIKLTF